MNKAVLVFYIRWLDHDLLISNNLSKNIIYLRINLYLLRHHSHEHQSPLASNHKAEPVLLLLQQQTTTA
jgi:hypothetical protein